MPGARPSGSRGGGGARGSGGSRGSGRSGGSRKRGPRAVERRIGLLSAVFLLAFTIVLGRAVWLQAVQGSSLASQAVSQQSELVEVPALRGQILDRRGGGLAVSEDAATVFATPYQVEDHHRTAAQLGPLVGLPDEDVLEALTADSGFSYIARELDLASAQRVEKLALPGIGLLPASRRTYPQGTLAAQVIGAVGSENQGLTGLEASEEETLRGTDGQRNVVHDALGEPIRLETITPAVDGADIELTLDAAIQSRTEQILAEVAATYQPKSATAIVMNPKDSELLAIANWPPMDPAEVGEAEPEQLVNGATGFTYEPGSTFKAMTVAGAVEDGAVSPESSFTLAPTLQVADREISESSPRGTETMSVAEILARSSNVGAVTIGQMLGERRFDRWVRRFGLGEPTGVRYPGEEQGIVPALEDYSGASIGNLPIGQGLSVTPMQMAAAFSVIAGDGTLRTPRLVRSVGGEPIATDPGRRVISPRTADQMREMLEGVIGDGGTVTDVAVPGYELAGKTGTSQVAEDGGYSETRYVASFIGFAPAENPRLLAAVVVNEPQGDIYGGSVAAPAFGEIASFALPYLGVAPE
ncbi:MAG TPA: penicillin-binding protein 2 [Solirubrobacterales bacterium]|nr:penicillin-binding protein 2 [Solirubrobacterales bacterium]